MTSLPLQQAQQRRRIVIAGGSGCLGRHLAQHLVATGHEVIVLARQAGRADDPWSTVIWDGRQVGDWTACLDGAEAVVNLCGRSVDCVKTPDHCDEILRSRVEPTRALGLALKQCQRPPAVWVQMGTAHIYGDPPAVICNEDAAVGLGLAPQVALAWEAAFAEAKPAATRGVILRTSFVLTASGGALRRLSALTRWGLGGRIGHGRQGLSWIHIDDLLALFDRALTDNSFSGAYLATAPNPVSNAEFMRELRRVFRRPGLPAAAWMVRIAAACVLRTDPELALYGRYCVSRRLTEAGFTFRHPELGPALSALFAKN